MDRPTTPLLPTARAAPRVAGFLDLVSPPHPPPRSVLTELLARLRPTHHPTQHGRGLGRGCPGKRATWAVVFTLLLQRLRCL